MKNLETMLLFLPIFFFGFNSLSATKQSSTKINQIAIGDSTKKQNSQIIYQGRIIDENGDPLVGVNIFSKDSSGIGTTTDLNGNYFLKNSGHKEIIASFIGYKEIVLDKNKEIIEMVPEFFNSKPIMVLGKKKREPSNLLTSKELGKVPEKGLGDLSTIIKSKVGNTEGVGSSISIGGALPQQIGWSENGIKTPKMGIFLGLVGPDHFEDYDSFEIYMLPPMHLANNIGSLINLKPKWPEDKKTVKTEASIITRRGVINYGNKDYGLYFSFRDFSLNLIKDFIKKNNRQAKKLPRYNVGILRMKSKIPLNSNLNLEVLLRNELMKASGLKKNSGEVIDHKTTQLKILGQIQGKIKAIDYDFQFLLNHYSSFSESRNSIEDDARVLLNISQQIKNQSASLNLKKFFKDHLFNAGFSLSTELSFLNSRVEEKWGGNIIPGHTQLILPPDFKNKLNQQNFECHISDTYPINSNLELHAGIRLDQSKGVGSAISYLIKSDIKLGDFKFILGAGNYNNLQSAAHLMEIGTPIIEDQRNYENSSNIFVSVIKNPFIIPNLNGKISFYSMNSNIRLGPDLSKEINQKNRSASIDLSYNLDNFNAWISLYSGTSEYDRFQKDVMVPTGYASKLRVKTGGSIEIGNFLLNLSATYKKGNLVNLTKLNQDNELIFLETITLPDATQLNLMAQYEIGKIKTGISFENVFNNSKYFSAYRSNNGKLRFYRADMGMVPNIFVKAEL
jgi:hypothetical protein